MKNMSFGCEVFSIVGHMFSSQKSWSEKSSAPHIHVKYQRHWDLSENGIYHDTPPKWQVLSWQKKWWTRIVFFSICSWSNQLKSICFRDKTNKTTPCFMDFSWWETILNHVKPTFLIYLNHHASSSFPGRSTLAESRSLSPSLPSVLQRPSLFPRREIPGKSRTSQDNEGNMHGYNVGIHDDKWWYMEVNHGSCL